MRVTPPDLEAYLTAHVRAQAVLDRVDVQVGNKEPATLAIPLKKPIIVIRDDGGPQHDYPTFDRSVGASVLAGTRTNDKPANDLARWLAGVLFDHDIATLGGPIAAVDMSGCNGPYAVQETLDLARRYLTAQYVVVGTHN